MTLPTDPFEGHAPFRLEPMRGLFDLIGDVLGDRRTHDLIHDSRVALSESLAEVKRLREALQALEAFVNHVAGQQTILIANPYWSQVRSALTPVKPEETK